MGTQLHFSFPALNMAAHANMVTDFKVGTTINQFIAAMERRQPEATGALSVVLMEIAVGCKLIASKIRRAGIADVLGKVSSENSTGDVQAKLDVQSNHVMKQRLMSAKYVICTDPLDGSSNIDCNVGVGTIFGIWRRVTEMGTPCDPQADCLQSGRAMLASGYVLYGSSVVFVLTLGGGTGVHEFTLDPELGEFVLSDESMTYPDVIKNYSINEGNSIKWDQGVRDLVDYFKADNKDNGTPISARYIGSLVADQHRSLKYGGIYAYPADRKNTNGKLRLLYECTPLALISEEAGGRSSNGLIDTLDIEPTSFHMRTPLYIGNKDAVDLADQFVQGTHPSQQQ